MNQLFVVAIGFGLGALVPLYALKRYLRRRNG